MLTLFSSGIHNVKSSITAALGSQIFFTLWSSGLWCFVVCYMMSKSMENNMHFHCGKNLRSHIHQMFLHILC